jgi:hypothetical protein
VNGVVGSMFAENAASWVCGYWTPGITIGGPGGGAKKLGVNEGLVVTDDTRKSSIT